MIAVILSAIDISGCNVFGGSIMVRDPTHSETEATRKPGVLKDILGKKMLLSVLRVVDS